MPKLLSLRAGVNLPLLELTRPGLLLFGVLGFFLLHCGFLPSVQAGGWGLAPAALNSTTRPSWDFSGAKVASEVGADVTLHGDTSPGSRSPSQHFTEESFGRAVVGSSISFCSFSLLIIIGSSFQWIKTHVYWGVGLRHALGVFIFLYVYSCRFPEPLEFF